MKYSIRNIYKNNPGVQIFILLDERDRKHLKKENDNTVTYSFSMNTSFIRRSFIEVFFYKLYHKFDSEFNYVFTTLSGRKENTDLKIIEFKETTPENFLKAKYKKNQSRDFILTLNKEPEDPFVFYLELGSFFYSDINNITIN